MRVYAVRVSYSLCARRKDWVPVQLFDATSDTVAIITFRDGPCCLVQF